MKKLIHTNKLARGEKILPSDADMLEEITAEYPLRTNYTVSISIPKDISEDEANRLAGFIKTLHSFK